MIPRVALLHFRGLQISPLRSRAATVVSRPKSFRTRQILPVRTYSVAQDPVTQNVSEPPSTGPTNNGQPKTEKPPTAEDPLRKEIEDKKREITDLKDKYLRSVADFRNLQDRTARDVAAARDFAISRFAKDLLDSVDNLDRAMGTVSETQLRPTDEAGGQAPNKDLVNLHDGIKMTETVLMQTLAKHGLERFDPSEEGEAFNPNMHEASFMAPIEGKEDGTVFNTIQKGFTLNGRVIRAAKVGVVKNS